MNPHTGEVRTFLGDTPQIGFHALPEALQEEGAQVAQTTRFVDLKSNTPLAKWARNKRKKLRKIAKASRKKNRG